MEETIDLKEVSQVLIDPHLAQEVFSSVEKAPLKKLLTQKMAQTVERKAKDYPATGEEVTVEISGPAGIVPPAVKREQVKYALKGEPSPEERVFPERVHRETGTKSIPRLIINLVVEATPSILAFRNRQLRALTATKTLCDLTPQVLNPLLNGVKIKEIGMRLWILVKGKSGAHFSQLPTKFTKDQLPKFYQEALVASCLPTEPELVNYTDFGEGFAFRQLTKLMVDDVEAGTMNLLVVVSEKSNEEMRPVHYSDGTVYYPVYHLYAPFPDLLHVSLTDPNPTGESVYDLLPKKEQR